jgi:hypothetical protein
MEHGTWNMELPQPGATGTSGSQVPGTGFGQITNGGLHKHIMSLCRRKLRTNGVPDMTVAGTIGYGAGQDFDMK